MRSSSRLKVSTCRTYSWWAISSLMGVGLRITFYTVWRIEEGEVEERGVLDVKRESKGERIGFWVKRRHILEEDGTR